MVIAYEHFIDKLNRKITSDAAEFNYELLVSVVKNPNRYTGIFRLSNAKTKLIQNVTQSREIKFGDFMEDIITEYIELMGYQNIDKHIGTDTEGNSLNADQVFMLGDTVYLIEQKIRDDHDSTKKRGQFDNFRKKFTLLKRRFPDKRINATMWFIDETLVKNYRYYAAEAAAENTAGVSLNIFYGGKLFSELFGRPDVWAELCSYLARNKQERSDEILNIPDFDTSEEMLIALRRLRSEERTLFRKLLSDAPTYVQLRAELFPSGTNLSRI